MSKRQEIFFRQLVITCDITTLLVSYALAYWVRNHLLCSWFGTLFPLTEYVWILWIIVPTWVFWLHTLRLYDSTTYASLAQTIGKLVQSQLLAGITLFSAMFLTKSEEVSRLFLQTFLGVSFLMLGVEKAGVKLALDYLRKRQSVRLRKVIIVGTDARAERFLHLLDHRPHWGTQVVGFLSPRDETESQFCGKPIVGQLGDFAATLQKHVVDEVVAVSPWEMGVNVADLATACAQRGITFRVLVEMPSAGVGHYHVEDLGKGSYLVSLETTPQAPLLLLMKRLLDIIGAFIGLILCGLAYLWYGPRISRESPGPILFRQTRVGQNGRRFTLYKFRTMYRGAEEQLNDVLTHNEMKGWIFKMKDDPRVTVIGRGLRCRHLDELPQFWNVIKGDMSLVGTRPPTPNELAQYLPHHHRRLSMKPGITGLWQLRGNGTVSNFEDIVKLDCEYIDSWSLWQDCKILAQTVMKVVKGGGW